MGSLTLNFDTTLSMIEIIHFSENPTFKHKSSCYMDALVACLSNKRNFSSNASVLVIREPNTNSRASNNPSRKLGSVGGMLRYTSVETYSVLQASCLQHWFKNWQTLRRNKLTASTFAAAIGFWRRQRVQLWLEKIGAIEPFSGNLATCWSNIKEEDALERYKLITGNTVYDTHPEDNWLAASPDGVIDRLVLELPSRGVLEIKCPYFDGDISKAFPWSRIPIHYIPQAQGLMEILGRDWMDFYVWTPNGSSLFRLHRDAEYWDVMKIALSDFWWKHVQPAREFTAHDCGQYHGKSQPPWCSRAKPLLCHPFLSFSNPFTIVVNSGQSGSDMRQNLRSGAIQCRGGLGRNSGGLGCDSGGVERLL
ncbi:hypothetical protein CR513_45996, partial [Mucuna pruriens]